MKVILLKELQGKGGEGDVIDVTRGFAQQLPADQGYCREGYSGQPEAA